MHGNLLGIDIGTSSCKVVLVAEAGEVLASETVSYPLSIPREGWSEQDPQDWVSGARDAIAKLKTKADLGGVSTIGLSGQMHGLTPLDVDLTVLRPAILWNDQRNEAECNEITASVGGLDALLELTNNRMLTGYTGGKVLWMRKHEPALYERLSHVLNPKDYLRLKLTGEIATEVSDASGTGLFDVSARDWSHPLLENAGIDPDILPACHESDIVSGRISRTAAEYFGLSEGIPVVGGGGDAVIQTLGSGVITADILQTTIGTAGIIATSLDSPVANPDGRLQVFCNVAPDKWHCMGVSMNAGGAFAWLRNIFASVTAGTPADLGFDQLIALAEQASPGSDGLLFLPYLMGERCPWPDPDARGAFLGLRAGHNETHIIRSLLEGVVFALRDMHALMQEVGGDTVAQLHASGGGSSASLWNQMQADVFDAEVLTVRGSAEGGAYGAALLAGVAAGNWSDIGEAARACVAERRWTPNPDNTERYRELFDIYQSLYPLLRPTFDRLSRFARVTE